MTGLFLRNGGYWHEHAKGWRLVRGLVFRRFFYSKIELHPQELLLITHPLDTLYPVGTNWGVGGHGGMS